MIPVQRFVFEYGRRKDGKDRQGDYFLYHFQLD